METFAPTLPRVRNVDVLVLPPLSVSERGLGGEVSSKRTTAARSVIAGAFTLLALHLGFGQYAERNPKRKDPTYGDKFDKLTARADDRPLVLMLGSSRTLLGFHAGQLESEHPELRAFNFGTPASGPITHLVYLRRLLDAGVVPDLLLIEVLPPALADGPDGPGEQMFLTGERLSSEEVDLVGRFGFPPSGVRAAWRESVYNPVSALRFQLLGRLLPSWIPWNLRGDWSRNTDAHGWATPPRQTVTAEERRERTANADAEYRRTLAGMTAEGRPMLALAELLELCRRRGVRARVLLMPEAPSFRNLYPVGLAEQLGEALRDVAVAHGAGFTDARNWLVEEDFYDGHHLFRSGAEAFTRRLTAEAIRPHFADAGGAR